MKGNYRPSADDSGLTANDPLRTFALLCFPSSMETRTLTNNERGFLKKIAERLPPKARERLLSDMSVAEVVQNGDFLEVHLRDYERPEYEGHRNLPFEGKLNDAHGGPVSMLVNYDQNDRLLEIETIWWSSESGTELDWITLEIVKEPAP